MDFLKNQLSQNLFKNNIKGKKINNISWVMLVYLDLCYFRGWKGLRLINLENSKSFYIFALNPKKKKQIEVFIPIRSNSRINFLGFHSLFVYLREEKKIFFRWLNLAFIEEDGTVTYYRLVCDFPKTCGPIIK